MFEREVVSSLFVGCSLQCRVSNPNAKSKNLMAIASIHLCKKVTATKLQAAWQESGLRERQLRPRVVAKRGN